MSDRKTDGLTYICDSRVAFATEKLKSCSRSMVVCVRLYVMLCVMVCMMLCVVFVCDGVSGGEGCGKVE